MEDGEDSMSSCCGWSWEENKKFEMALARIDEDSPERWIEIASMIGGKKSVEEVMKHYEALLDDLNAIESGMLDQEFTGRPRCTQHLNWTDDDQKLLTEPSIEDDYTQLCLKDVHLRCSSNL